MKRYVIDTETTGLDPENDELLQLAVVDERGNTVFNRKFRPERLTSWEEAEKINYISPESVADAPAFAKMLPEINEMFAKCSVIAGYRTGFDLAFLMKAGAVFPENTEVVDVQAMFIPVAGEWDWENGCYARQSLVKCAEFCGYEWSGSPHDALADALATLHCWKALVELITTSKETYKNLPTPEDDACSHKFKKLCKPYPDAMVSVERSER